MTKCILFIICLFFWGNSICAQSELDDEPVWELEKLPEDRVFKNGFWVDFGVGMSLVYEERSIAFKSHSIKTEPASWKSAHAFSGRFGNKWYYTGHTRYQLGFQATWLGAGVDVANGGWYVDIGAAGFCSLFRTGEKSGVEVNLNLGPSIYTTDLSYWGAQANMELKYRVGYLSLGTMFRYFTGGHEGRTQPSIVNFLLLLGVKF